MTPQSALVHARGLAGTVGGIGLVLSSTGKPSEAEVEYRTSLAIQQKLAEENPAVTLLSSELAQSHDNFAVLLRQKGKPREAEAEYRAALVIRQKLADENPGIPGLQRVLADALLNLGWWLAQAGKPAEAIGYYTREEAIRQTLAAASATPNDRDWLANCQTNMTDVLRRSGRLDEARCRLRAPLAVREPLVEAHPERPRYSVCLGDTFLRLGQVRCDMKDLAGAAGTWNARARNSTGSSFLSQSGRSY